MARLPSASPYPKGQTCTRFCHTCPLTGASRSMWWYTQRADYRGMLPCVLSHGTTRLTTFTQVNGMGSELYPQVASVPPSLHPFDATFEVGQVLEVGRLPLDFVANQAVCLPIRVRLTQPTSAELKAVVRVMNQHQREVTRAEGVFATANGRTSTDGTLGEVLTAFPHFRLPLGAPSEPYTVTLYPVRPRSLGGLRCPIGATTSRENTSDWNLASTRGGGLGSQRRPSQRDGDSTHRIGGVALSQWGCGIS
ncbi:MAG UNVERIFIED_CONTAM: hypothetical protein LVT10_27700 [Anaerolineae bacterium]